MSDNNGRPAPGINRLFGPDALSNVFGALATKLGVQTEQPYVAGPGDPAAGTGVVDTTETASSVQLQEPAEVPTLVVRHIVETIERGSSDFRIYRVQVGPWAQAVPGGGSPSPTTVCDANPTRTKVRIRNVSATAVSIFLVRAGTGGGGAYDNMGYRLNQNGETIEIDTTAGVEAYCTLNTDIGLLQVIEEFSATDDTGQLATPE